MLNSTDACLEISVTTDEPATKCKRTQRNRKTLRSAKQRPINRNESKSEMNNQHINIKPVNTQQRLHASKPQSKHRKNLNLNEAELTKYLSNYLMDESLMRLLGFPIAYDMAPNLAIIYKYPPYEFVSQRKQSIESTESGFNNGQINDKDGLISKISPDVSDDSDSGQGSGTSSPTENFDIIAQSPESITVFKHSSNSTQRECSRCGAAFYVTSEGSYETLEPCFYHWGKAYRFFDGKQMRNVFSCCNRDDDGSSENGCSANRVHVWTGITSGINGPFEGFVRTRIRPRRARQSKSTLAFALDCEMCFTALGLELTKISVVTLNGDLFYESFVRPEHAIVDYNTRFSGITEQDLFALKNKNVEATNDLSIPTVKSLKQVQNDLLKFIFDDTILIGHAIENDLRALKLIHHTIIDTSIIFPHQYGLPYRRSLKVLAQNILKKEIQQSQAGHCSYEDSKTSLCLMLWRVEQDFLKYPRTEML